MTTRLQKFKLKTVHDELGALKVSRSTLKLIKYFQIRQIHIADSKLIERSKENIFYD